MQTTACCMPKKKYYRFLQNLCDDIETEETSRGSCIVACGFGESLRQSTERGTAALHEEVRSDREACWGGAGTKCMGAVRPG